MKPQRLESLDVLRGFDLFCLGFFQPLLGALTRASANPALETLYRSQFSHVEWHGFAFWDIIMPLFMFMAGVSMPFAFSGYFKGETSSGKMYRRIAKRVVLLFIFGAMVQGNLLALDIYQLRLYSNTLQAIGVGYLFTALIVMHVRNIKIQVGITSGLLILFWGVYTWWGDYTPEGNIAEMIDKAVLGRFRDGVKWDEAHTSWNFSDSYHYTWILSSLNFTVTVMTGYFAGVILKNKRDWKQKIGWLIGVGVAMCVVAIVWDIQHPIVKKVWSSSMTLLSSGYCFLLMALFYYLVDVRGFRKQLVWLKPYGMNSILAYMMFNLLQIKQPLNELLAGTAQFLGPYQNVLITIAQGAIIYAILWHLYKMNKFFKV
ncbi:DUF5009 domain-containing protein [Porphyromonadaceae bacterium]